MILEGLFHHKGYTGCVEFDADNGFYGKVLNINDLIAYQGETVNELEQSFKDGIDEYLDTCQEIGKKPNN